MNIYVPSYNENGLTFCWEEGFFIKCLIDDDCVRIEANREGLISLARHLLELAQENVPEYTHFHLDEFNSLEKNSTELVIIKRKTQ